MAKMWIKLGGVVVNVDHIVSIESTGGESLRVNLVTGKFVPVIKGKEVLAMMVNAGIPTPDGLPPGKVEVFSSE